MSSTRATRTVLAIASLLFGGPILSTELRAAESWPPFCVPVEPGLLKGLSVPYAPKTSADGTKYCEGLLPTPIALALLESGLGEANATSRRSIGGPVDKADVVCWTASWACSGQHSSRSASP